MATKNTVNVLFSASETVDVAAGGNATSDAFAMNTQSGDAVRALVKVKADNQGAPAADDEIDVYLLRGGDPDADSTQDYDTATQGELVMTLDTNDNDPAVRSRIVDGPFPDSGQLYLVSRSGSNTIRVSAEIIELYA